MTNEITSITTNVQAVDAYKRLIKTLRHQLLGREYYRAADALEYGINIHCGKRKDLITPEFQHQVEIALYVMTIRASLTYPEDTIIAALLHDTPEDYYVDHRYISERFGSACGDAIYLLDKNGKSLDAYFSGIASNPIASIVKGSDRMHNVRSMQGAFTLAKKVTYVAEVRERFLPMIKLAKRSFPRQTDAYENIKHILNIQLEMYDVINQSHLDQQEAASDISQPGANICTSHAAFGQGGWHVLS